MSVENNLSMVSVFDNDIVLDRICLSKSLYNSDVASAVELAKQYNIEKSSSYNGFQTDVEIIDQTMKLLSNSSNCSKWISFIDSDNFRQYSKALTNVYEYLLANSVTAIPDGESYVNAILSHKTDLTWFQNMVNGLREERNRLNQVPINDGTLMQSMVETYQENSDRPSQIMAEWLQSYLSNRLSRLSVSERTNLDNFMDGGDDAVIDTDMLNSTLLSLNVVSNAVVRPSQISSIPMRTQAPTVPEIAMQQPPQLEPPSASTWGIRPIEVLTKPAITDGGFVKIEDIGPETGMDLVRYQPQNENTMLETIPPEVIESVVKIEKELDPECTLAKNTPKSLYESSGLSSPYYNPNVPSAPIANSGAIPKILQQNSNQLQPTTPPSSINDAITKYFPPAQQSLPVVQQLSFPSNEIVPRPSIPTITIDQECETTVPKLPVLTSPMKPNSCPVPLNEVSVLGELSIPTNTVIPFTKRTNSNNELAVEQQPLPQNAITLPQSFIPPSTVSSQDNSSLALFLSAQGNQPNTGISPDQQQNSLMKIKPPTELIYPIPPPENNFMTTTLDLTNDLPPSNRSNDLRNLIGDIVPNGGANQLSTLSKVIDIPLLDLMDIGSNIATDSWNTTMTGNSEQMELGDENIVPKLKRNTLLYDNNVQSVSGRMETDEYWDPAVVGVDKIKLNHIRDGRGIWYTLEDVMNLTSQTQFSSNELINMIRSTVGPDSISTVKVKGTDNSIVVIKRDALAHMFKNNISTCPTRDICLESVGRCIDRTIPRSEWSTNTKEISTVPSMDFIINAAKLTINIDDEKVKRRPTTGVEMASRNYSTVEYTAGRPTALFVEFLGTVCNKMMQNYNGPVKHRDMLSRNVAA